MKTLVIMTKIYFNW